MNKHAYNYHCSLRLPQFYLWAKRSLIYLWGQGQPDPSPARQPAQGQPWPTSHSLPSDYAYDRELSYSAKSTTVHLIISCWREANQNYAMRHVQFAFSVIYQKLFKPAHIREFSCGGLPEACIHWGRGALSCCDGDGCLSKEIHAERGAKDLPHKWGGKAKPMQEKSVGMLLLLDRRTNEWIDPACFLTKKKIKQFSSVLSAQPQNYFPPHYCL